MEQRHRFVVLAEAGDRSISELCEQFGISRKTGHKWLKRFCHSGQAGLADQSRIPKSSPGKTPEKLERLIVAEKRRRPTWGPKKIRRLLETRLRWGQVKNIEFPTIIPDWACRIEASKNNENENNQRQTSYRIGSYFLCCHSGDLLGKKER